jgi:6-pyruvoyltetrahydropterin/6-carboxytetrahydropterin synthase
MIQITRKEHFNAAHRLFREDLNDAQNLELFGKCSNPNWHGHNYILYVTVAGEPDPYTGYLMDLRLLSKIVQESVILKLDHKNINLEVEFMRGKLASAENLAIAIWEQLEAPIAAVHAKLVKVALHETESNYVEYFGKTV